MIETTLLPKNIGSPELVYQDHIRCIYRKVVEFEGFTKQYFISDTGMRAAALVTCGSYVLLARQYRLLINNINLEILVEKWMRESLRKMQQLASILKRPVLNGKASSYYSIIIPDLM
jgi:hypothetical protein